MRHIEKKCLVTIGDEKDVRIARTRLEQKWRLKGKHTSSCAWIAGKVDDALTSAIKKLEPSTELVILAHGKIDDPDHLHASTTQSVSIIEIANMLESHLTPPLGSVDYPLKINLVACNAGYEYSNKASIAKNLLAALFRRNIHATAIARKSIVHIDSSGRKATLATEHNETLVRITRSPKPKWYQFYDKNERRSAIRGGLSPSNLRKHELGHKSRLSYDGFSYDESFLVRRPPNPTEVRIRRDALRLVRRAYHQYRSKRAPMPTPSHRTADFRCLESMLSNARFDTVEQAAVAIDQCLNELETPLSPVGLKYFIDAGPLSLGSVYNTFMRKAVDELRKLPHPAPVEDKAEDKLELGTPASS